MQEMLIKMLLPVIVDFVKDSILTKENKQKYGDKMLDMLEDYFIDSETEVDDRLLPLIQHVRKMFDIPDLPDVEEVAK